MKLRHLALLGISLLSIPLQSYGWWRTDTCFVDSWFDDWNYTLTGDIQVSGGYRWDQINCTVDSFTAPGVFAETDRLKVNDLSVYEVGAKGRLWLGNFYLRGFGYTGWGHDGTYHEQVTAGADTSRSHAHVSNTRTQDALFGFGYLFTYDDCWDNCWGIGPVGGWSYAHQRIKLKRGITNGEPDTIFDGLVYKNRWSGPWVGVDLAFKRCDFIIDFGYEYHWANWHAEWELRDDLNTPTAFSDQRRSRNAHGNVVYIDGYWNFCPGWELGVGYRYQEWAVNRGRLKPRGNTEAAGLPSTFQAKVKHAKWWSNEITVNLGYVF